MLCVITHLGTQTFEQVLTLRRLFACLLVLSTLHGCLRHNIIGSSSSEAAVYLLGAMDGNLQISAHWSQSYWTQYAICDLLPSTKQLHAPHKTINCICTIISSDYSNHLVTTIRYSWHTQLQSYAAGLIQFLESLYQCMQAMKAILRV